MKIVVLDGYTLNPGDISWEGLKKIGECTIYDRTPEDKVMERSRNCEILFTNKTPITKEMLTKMNEVKYIGVLATGYNVVDVEAARDKGITVTNIPTYGTSAVAQMTFALLLELCHHVGAHSELVKKGEWTNCSDFCFWRYPLIELCDKTIGIIGFGRIGQEVAKIAQSFGLRVLAHDLYPKYDSETKNLKFVELEDVFVASDIISLHCPLFDSTREMINQSTISTMKTGVMILNTSRGSLIAEKDLADALNCGKVAGAAVDVVSTEPINADNPLLSAKNCIITPHIAWAPKESRQRLMSIAVENLEYFLKGTPMNVI